MSQQINLFNPIFLRQEKYFSAKTMIESLTLILIALCAFYVYARNQVGSLESVAIESTRQLDNARDSLIKLGGEYSPERRSKLLEARVARAEAEVRGKEALLASLNATATGRAPAYSEYLAAFARHALPGVWLTGFSVDGGGEELRIQGRVLHPDLVPAYIHALNSEAVMRGRSVSRLKLVAHRESPAAGSAPPAAGPSRYVEFDLSMPLRAPRAAAETPK